MLMPTAQPEHLRSAFDAEELSAFSRSMADLHWLLLILVLAYYFMPTGPLTSTDAVIMALVSYTAFVLVFRYMNTRAHDTRIGLVVETWAMIVFITVVLQHTGYIESPLLNLYLLVSIASAITLGMAMTALQVLLIASCYLYLGFQQFSTDMFSAHVFTLIMAKFSPFLLVAGVTSMLAADILAAKRRITLLSRTDELTGLLNWRAFNTILKREVAHAARYKQPVTLALLDVDGFRQFHDHYGHVTGSQLIQSVANALQRCVRASDVLARFGDDKFVVLMPNTGIDDARRYVERIHFTVTNTTLSVNGQCIAASASIGLASYPGGVDRPQALLEKADLALYSSKRYGENRITNYVQELEAVPFVT